MPLVDEIPDLPEDYLKELGRVSFRWAVLESILDICLIKVLNLDIHDKRSIVVFNHMSFPMKLDVMGAMVSVLPSYPALAMGYPAVAKLLNQAAKERNAVVHAKWGADPNTGVISTSRVKAKGKLTVEQRAVTVEELRATCELIYRAAEELHNPRHVLRRGRQAVSDSLSGLLSLFEEAEDVLRL